MLNCNEGAIIASEQHLNNYLQPKMIAYHNLHKQMHSQQHQHQSGNNSPPTQSKKIKKCFID